MQEKMNKTFPYPFSSTALMSLMGLIQSVAFALCVDRDWNIVRHRYAWLFVVLNIFV